MTCRKYAFEGEDVTRLELSWNGGWKGAFDDLQLRLDGSTIGEVPDRAAMEQGRTFVLPDGSELSIKVLCGWLNRELEVLRDGSPVPGSDTHPRQRIRSAGKGVWLLAALWVAIGIFLLVRPVEHLESLTGPYGAVAFFMAALFGTLAYLITSGSTWALFTALGLFVLEVVSYVVELTTEANPGSQSALVLRILLLLSMARGARAAFTLRRRGRESVPAT